MPNLVFGLKTLEKLKQPSLQSMYNPSYWQTSSPAHLSTARYSPDLDVVAHSLSVIPTLSVHTGIITERIKNQG